MSKAELKTKATNASVASYITAITDPQQRKDAKVLLALMQSAVGEKPKMWGTSIVGFGTYRYKYASGREGDWMRVGLSARKTALTLYLSCNLDEFTPLLQRLGTYKRGKGCLYLKRLSDVDLSILKKMIVIAAKRKLVVA